MAGAWGSAWGTSFGVTFGVIGGVWVPTEAELRTSLSARALPRKWVWEARQRLWYSTHPLRVWNTQEIARVWYMGEPLRLWNSRESLRYWLSSNINLMER